VERPRPQGAVARLIHFVTPRSRRTIARVACGGNLNLPWLLRSVVVYGSRSRLTTGSYA